VISEIVQVFTQCHVSGFQSMRAISIKRLLDPKTSILTSAASRWPIFPYLTHYKSIKKLFVG